VYPNPAAGSKAFTLADVPGSAGVLTLDFLLPQGPRLVSLQGLPEMLQGELNRYTTHLAPGIYVLKLKGKNFEQTQRVMKE
jgi:hypothetical protein